MGLYRASRFCYLKLPYIGSALALCIRHFMRFYTGCDLSPMAIIEVGVKFPHPLGIVIGDGVHIKSGAKLWQQVTIGSHGKAGEEMAYPLIESDVRIYAKASVIGAVHVCDCAIVGAHSLVLEDVPAHGIVVGVPAKLLKRKA